MQLDPRDQLRFYALPAWSKVTLPAATAASIVKADPSRVGLIISGFNSTTPMSFATDPTILSNGVGIVLFNQTTFILINHNDFPGLPQQEWFGFSTPGQVIAVAEVRLQSTPEDIAHVENNFARQFRSGAIPGIEADSQLLTQEDYAAILRSLLRDRDAIQRSNNGVGQRDNTGARGIHDAPQAVGRWRYGPAPVVRALQRWGRPR